MKFKSICLSSMLIYGLYIGTAQPEAILTSKAYVDNKVPAYASGGSPSLLTDTTTTGTIAKRAIFTDGTTYVAGTHANQIPTMGAVMSAVSSGSQSPIPAGSYGANNSLVTYDDTAGTVQERWILGEGTEEMEDDPAVGTIFYANRLRTDFSGDSFGTLADENMTAITKTEAEESLVPAKIISKALLSKQDNIPGHAANAADSLLTDSTTTGTVQKRAIFTDGTTYVAGTHATQIPTMGAVMSAISGGTTALPWATAEQNATGAYSTTFAASGTNVWPTADADKVVKGQTFANAMATKQNKIAASEWENSSNNTIPGVVISTDENGVVEQRMILDKTSGISDQAIAETVARGYDNGDDYSITFDIHSNSVDANDVNNAVPTTTMTIAIANAAANAAANNATAALPWATAEQNATGAYSTTFAASGTNVWPTADADKVVKGQTFANAMATKQNKIPMATTPTGLYTDGSVVTHTNSDGIVGEKHIINDQMFDDLLGGQENWNTEYRNMLITAGSVYDGLSTKQNKITAHAANAADSLLTDSTTTGTVQKRAIFTDGTTYVAGTHANQIPTMGAVMSAVSAGTNAVDISSHTVNGAPLSNSASYFYGTSSTGSTTPQKEVSIPSITSLAVGQIIVVQPSATSTVANSTLKLNDFAAYPMRYNGAAITTSTDAVVWNQTHPSVWLFDGTYWVFVADANSTYGSMSVEEGVAGTAQSGRVLRADYLKRIIQETTLTGLSTSDATAVAATDNITTGIGKLQAQITDVAGDIPTLPTGPSGSIATYMAGTNNTGTIGGSLDVLTSSGSGNYNYNEIGWSEEDSMVPTIGAVDKKMQSKIPAQATKVNSSDSTFAPSVVTNTATPGVVGQMAILTYAKIQQDGKEYDEYTPDNLIPTIGAVGHVAERMTEGLPWNTAEQNATGAYSTTFADSGTNVWPMADSGKVVKGETFANAMATKQNKIPMATTPTGLYTGGSVVTHTNSDGIVGEKHIIDGQMFDSLVEGQENWNSEYRNMLITAGSVYDGLSTKQNKIAGHAANAADSVLTDSTTAGTVQKRAIFTDGTTYVAGTHANQIPTMGAVMSAISDGTPTLRWTTAEQNAANAYSATFANTGTNVWPVADADKFIMGDSLAKALARKQNILSANDDRSYPDGSLVEYGRSDGVPKERKIVTTVAQSGNDIPTDGAVFSAVAGKANKPTCTLTKPGDSSICYAWTFADVGASCAAYNETVSSASECCSGVTYSYISGKISSLLCGCASASDCPSGTPNCSATTHQCSEGRV